MKISQEEIDAARDAWNTTAGSKNVVWTAILEAALTVRKQRKASKRERQRKEKDKQVVESVKPAKPFTFWEYSAGDWTKLHVTYDMGKPLVTPSKAPEWDGTFGCGDWVAIGGERISIHYRDGTLMLGTIGSGGDSTWYSRTGSNVNDDRRDLDLIRPWPKGEQ